MRVLPITDFIRWLAPQAGEMKRILCSCLLRIALFAPVESSFGHIIIPLMTNNLWQVLLKFPCCSPLDIEVSSCGQIFSLPTLTRGKAGNISTIMTKVESCSVKMAEY